MKAATHDSRRAASVSFAEVVELRGQAAGLEADAAPIGAKRKTAGTFRTSKRNSRWHGWRRQRGVTGER
jgi:hypothetical protein